MTDEEFRQEQMKLFDETLTLRSMLHLIFSFLVNLAIQIKRLTDELDRDRRDIGVRGITR
jgi:hypothetical protein